jgi:plastocyanin
VRLRPPTLVAAALASALVACSSDGGTDLLAGQRFADRTGRRAVTVDARDNVFAPQFVEISAGTTVTFRNEGRNDHNVLAVDDAFASVPVADFEPGATATVTFPDAGDYPYYCSLHGTPTKGMRGGIRVVG